MWGIVSFEMSAWQMTAPFLVMSEQVAYNDIVREKHFRFGRCAQGHLQHEAFA